MKKGLIISILILALLAVGVYIVFTSFNREEKAESLINTNTLAQMSKQDKSTVSTTRLASGVTPPTNKWFTGIALQDSPKTVFPTPLAFKPTDTGFSYGLTGVETSENAVIANHRDDIAVRISEASYYLITRYDELSVDLTYYNSSDKQLALVTIASGSPYIFVKSLTSNLAFSTNQQFNGSNDIYSYDNQHALYAIAGITGSDNTFTINGNVASFYAGKKLDDITALTTHALNKINSVKVSYENTGSNYVTRFAVTTDNNKETILGALPHADFNKNSLFSVSTIYGSQDFYAGNEFEFETAKINTPDGALDLTSITTEERSELITMLRREINSTKFTGIDTYFSGKELYRSAQLLKLANQLAEPEIASTIQKKLSYELGLWFSAKDNRTSKYFYYDTKLKSVVGTEASFGSSDANDHHFHYGYFIYAASILAQYDAKFLNEHKDMVNLLVADIANYNLNEDLIQRRSFDPYFGHSWASGNAPFDDGNNQESSSEAINAWVGVSLWAQVSKNQALSDEAEWLLSQEVNATQAYWLSDVTPVENSKYKHTIYSLNWGGKRDYSTFFTAEPAAKLGILLIPLNPTMQSDAVLKRDSIEAQLQEANAPTSTSAYNFQDYLLMYNAHKDPAQALKDVKAFDIAKIDGANSQSYMYAWAISVR